VLSAGTCSGTTCNQTFTACNAGYSCSEAKCASSCSGASTGCAAGYTCIGDGAGNMVCCATSCTDAACGNKAFCAANGSGCQTHAGESCSSCSTDQLSMLSGTCNGSGGCTTTTPGTSCSGYLCASGACKVSCASNSDCDVSNSYTCSGTSCVLLPDAG
jgi:hypothetical protein